MVHYSAKHALVQCVHYDAQAWRAASDRQPAANSGRLGSRSGCHNADIQAVGDRTALRKRASREIAGKTTLNDAA